MQEIHGHVRFYLVTLYIFACAALVYPPRAGTQGRYKTMFIAPRGWRKEIGDDIFLTAEKWNRYVFGV